MKDIDAYRSKSFCLDVIEHISENFEIDQIYEKEEIFDWVNVNSEPEDVFTKQKLLDWARNCKPDEIFNENDLNEWADKYEREHM